MMPDRKSLCTECGHDLTRLTGRPCPECGNLLEALTLSPRAVRWSRQPRLWLGVPIGVFAAMLLVWCFLLEPATGQGLANVGSFIGAFAVILLGSLFVHAIAWVLTTGETAEGQLRGQLWWLTLPALHLVGVAWPLVVLLVNLVDSQFEWWRFYRKGAAASVVLLSPMAWRLSWWLGSSVTDIRLRPTIREWLAAFIIGVPSASLGLIMIWALSTVDV